MIENFEFKNHICIVFELLYCTLYDFQASCDYMGFSLEIL